MKQLQFLQDFLHHAFDFVLLLRRDCFEGRQIPLHASGFVSGHDLLENLPQGFRVGLARLEHGFGGLERILQLLLFRVVEGLPI